MHSQKAQYNNKNNDPLDLSSQSAWRPSRLGGEVIGLEHQATYNIALPSMTCKYMGELGEAMLLFVDYKNTEKSIIVGRVSGHLE